MNTAYIIFKIDNRAITKFIGTHRHYWLSHEDFVQQQKDEMKARFYGYLN